MSRREAAKRRIISANAAAISSSNMLDFSKHPNNGNDVLLLDPSTGEPANGNGHGHGNGHGNGTRPRA